MASNGPEIGEMSTPQVPDAQRLGDLHPAKTVLEDGDGLDAHGPGYSVAHEQGALTLRETWDELKERLAGVRGTRWERPIAAVAMVTSGFLALIVVSGVVPWSGGILETAQRVAAMDVDWVPIPAPDDPRLASDRSLAAATWVGAPLVLSVFWLTAAYHLDRSARRAFGISRIPGVRHSIGYTAIAVLVVFPLIVLGLASGAWGLFSLGTWAVTFETWGVAATLVGVLAVFVVVVRLGNAALDRRSAQP